EHGGDCSAGHGKLRLPSGPSRDGHYHRDEGRQTMQAGEHHETRDVEALDPGAFGDLRAFCLFIGYPKSGHSLVGALLDAHPDMVIARAVNPLALVVADGLPPAKVFETLLENSREEAARGRKQNKYRYEVEGQWQGRVRNLRVL